MLRFRRQRFFFALSLVFLIPVLFTSSAFSGERSADCRDSGSSLSVDDLPADQSPSICSVMIKGNAHYSSAFVRKWLSGAVTNGRLDRSGLMRAVMLLNDLPDLDVFASLAPVAGKAAYDLIVTVRDRRNVHLKLGYDNFGTLSSGENRMTYEFSLSSLLSCGDLLLLKWIDPFGGRASSPQYYTTYSLPVNRRGTRMSLAVSSIDTMIPGELSGEDMEGLDTYEILRNSQIYTLSFSSPLERTISISSNVVGGFSAKHYGERKWGGLIDTSDEVRFLFWGFNREEKHGPLRLSYSLMASQGLGTIFGGMDEYTADTRREMISGRYSKLSGSMTIRQNLGKRDFFNIRGTGQISNSRLATSEEIPVGGPDSVRGYARNEFRGDEGFFMNLEYHHQLIKGKDGRRPLEVLAFYDFGQVRTINTMEDERREVSLHGAGLGLRATAGPSTDIRLDFGWPIEPPANRAHRNPYIYTQMTIRL